MEEAAVVVLREHVEDAAVAERLGKTPLRKYPTQSQLQSDLEVLREWGNAFPTVMKFDVLDWYLEQHSEAARIQDFLIALCPWRFPHEKKDGVAWTPPAPRLALIEGSLQELSRHFRTKLTGLLCIGIRKGDSFSKDMAVIVQAVLRFLDEHAMAASDSEGDEDESAFDDDIGIVVEACKSIQLLMQVGTPDLSEAILGASEHLDAIRRSKDFKGQRFMDSPFALLAKALDEDTGFYKARLQLIDHYLLPLRTHWAALIAATEKMKKAPVECSKEVANIYVDGLKLLAAGLAELPSGSCVDMAKEMREQTTAFVKAALAILPTLMEKDPNSYIAAEADFVSVLQAAESALVEHASEWQEARHKVQGFKTNATVNKVVAAFETTLATIAAPEGSTCFDPSLAPALQSSIAAIQQSIELPSDSLDKFRELVLKAADCCLASVVDRESFDIWQAMSVDLLEMLTPKAECRVSQTLRAVARQKEACFSLARAREKFDAIAGDMNMKLQAPQLDTILKEWQVLRKKAEALKGTACDTEDSKMFTEELELSARKWQEVKAAMLASSEGKVEVAMKALGEHLKACAWPMSLASAEVDYDTFLKNADTWLTYPEAAELTKNIDDLTKAEASLTSFTSLFEETQNDDFMESIRRLMCLSEALIWSVRTVKKIAEADNAVKLTRFCKKQAASLKATGKDHRLEPFIPASLMQKLNSSSSM